MPVYVVSAHPIVATLMARVIGQRLGIPCGTLSGTRWPASFASNVEGAALFVIDTMLLPLSAVMAAQFFRVRWPGSRFLILLPSEQNTPSEMLKLVSMGVEGVARLDDNLRRVLPRAVQTILSGDVWVPKRVMAQYLRQTETIFKHRFGPEVTLTGRQDQVLRLVLRHWTNKEIALELGISHRTAKFHVSNVLAKLRFPSRRALLAALQAAE